MTKICREIESNRGSTFAGNRWGGLLHPVDRDYLVGAEIGAGEEAESKKESMSLSLFMTSHLVSIRSLQQRSLHPLGESAYLRFHGEPEAVATGVDIWPWKYRRGWLVHGPSFSLESMVST